MSTPVINRTPREWVEDCDRCRGTGKRRMRERFALWTPDEFEHVRPLDPKYDVPRDAYVVTASPGSSILEACTEAVGLAKIVGRPVAFDFNGTAVVIRADDVPNARAQQWLDRLRVSR